MDHPGICLHIGCGLDIHPDWDNIDASPALRLARIPLVGRPLLALLRKPQWPAAARWGDLVQGLDVAPNSCQLIFASHILEHLALEDFHVALQHIHSYLQPGGVFRTIMPDLEQYITMYLQRRADPEEVIYAAYHFNGATILGNLGSRNGLKARLAEAFANHRHQWLWDEPSLMEALTQHGFKNLRRCQFGEWSDPRFAQIENELKHNTAICVEATKL
jgi:hypothetical protein